MIRFIRSQSALGSGIGLGRVLIKFRSKMTWVRSSPGTRSRAYPKVLSPRGVLTPTGSKVCGGMVIFPGENAGL